MGMVGYNLNQVPTPPSTYVTKSNATNYGFFGRYELGPGRLETGFLYTKTSITTSDVPGNMTVEGSYWIIPMLYRYAFFEPFFSIAVGPDFAIVGNRSLTANGTPISGPASGYRGHWGLEASFEAAQDLGENLSAVLDVRYRMGLASAVSFGGQGTKFHFWGLALGLQKRFDP